MDILARKPGQSIAVEVETGKSDIKENLNKIKHADFGRVVLFATSPMAVAARGKAMNTSRPGASGPIEMLTWLDIS